MARNFLRTCSLSLTGSSSRTITSSGDEDLTIIFDIRATTLQNPNPGSFRVMNPSLATIAAFKNKEFRSVEFSAGYQDHSGVIEVDPICGTTEPGLLIGDRPLVSLAF